MSELHPLAERYLDAIFALPDSLRVRRVEEDQVAAALTAGSHVCVRGFWGIGKTTLMRGVLQRAVERTGGAGFQVDLRSEEGEPKTAQALLERIARKVQDFLGKVGATELKADPKQPFAILGELAAPLFIGLDEVNAVHALGPEWGAEVLAALLATPKNVKLLFACHRHRDSDAFFERHLVGQPNVSLAALSSVTDEELVQLVQTPAQECGVTFANEALGVMAEVCGNRPWELFALGHVVASKLDPGFKGTLTPEQVEAAVSLDVLAENEEGQRLLDGYLSILVAAMTPEEREVMELLAVGGEREVPEDALQRLVEAGWVLSSEGYAINGSLMELIVRGVAEGEIKVSVG